MVFHTVFIVALLVNQIWAATPATLVLLTGETNNGAACLDGSPPAYYIHEGSGSGANKWFLHHQGGGYCTSLEDCNGRAHSGLGSSKGYGRTGDLGGGYFSTDEKSNPLMYNWNMVLFMYCDGGFYGGNNDTLSYWNGQSLYFRGYKNRVAYVKDLTANHGLSRATDIIVGGCSAGGVATHLQLDWWRDNLPKGSTVKGLPDSGFVLDYNTPPGQNVHNAWKWIFKQMNFQSDPDCVAAHTTNPELCVFPEYAAPYVTTPMFPLQSQYDEWQLQNVLGTTDTNAVNQFGQVLETRFKATVLKHSTNGCFLDSCVHHCGNWDSIVIDNKDSGQALKDWYEGQNGQHFQGKTYPCNPCCNRGFDYTTI